MPELGRLEMQAVDDISSHDKEQEHRHCTATDLLIIFYL